MTRKIALPAALSVLFIFFSCATLQQMVQAPDVKVEDINIVDFSFEDITLDFGLLVNNPNPIGINLQGYEYTFAIQGKEFLSANKSSTLDVGAATASKVHIPVTVNFSDIIKLARQTKELDSLSFRIAGKLHPGGMLSAFDIPFERSGKLPNVRIPEINFSGLKVKKMGFTGVDLELELAVLNKNVFGFDIDTLNYNVALAGAEVAAGATQKLAAIPAKGTGTITLPISVNFASALGSLSSALRGGRILADIKGDADLHTPFGPVTLPFATTQEIPIIK